MATGVLEVLLSGQQMTTVSFSPRSQVGVLLVEMLERLWSLGLEWRLARQALKDDRPETPKIGLRIVL